MQRPILATQSDYGTADGRAAALSGNILKIAPEADIYSVLDLYPEGDALNAGGMIYSVLPFFPEGTVYVSVVEDHTTAPLPRGLTFSAQRRPLRLTKAGLPRASARMLTAAPSLRRAWI